MAICENCSTDFTPSEARTEVASLRILCEKCEAERKAEKARRAAEKSQASAPKTAPPVPATRRASPAPASAPSVAASPAAASAKSTPMNATPPAASRSATPGAPRVVRPAPTAPPPAEPVEPPSARSPRPSAAASSKSKPRSGTPDVRREIELLKRRENKVMMIGWIVCGVLALAALGTWLTVQGKKAAERAAVEAAKKEVEDFAAKMKSFDITKLDQANAAIALADEKKKIWEESSVSGDVGTIVAHAKTNLEMAKDRKETEDRLANAEQVIQNAANETPQIIAKTRRILSDLENKQDVMGEEFKTRVAAAKSVIDKTYANRLRDEAKALAGKGPSEARAALTAYGAAEDEMQKLYEESMRRKNKEAETYYKALYQEVITESDTLATAVFTPEVIEKAPWKDLLAGDSKNWVNAGMKGFRIDSGTLQAVGPEVGANQTGIMSIGDREQWRDFELDIEFTLVSGTAEFYFRLGRRTENAGELYKVAPGDTGIKLGEKFAAKVTFIGSKITIAWSSADITPWSNEAVRWQNTRKGAFGATLTDGSELRISRLRIRELR